MNIIKFLNEEDGVSAVELAWLISFLIISGGALSIFFMIFVILFRTAFGV